MLNRDKKNNKLNIFLLILIAIVTILFGKSITSGTEIINKFILPIQSKVFSVGESISENVYFFKNYNKIIAENKSLKIDNQMVQVLERRNKILFEENIKLIKLLELKDKSEDTIKIARVKFRNAREIYNQFYIDLGKVDGISKNMPVVIGNSLIGKIAEVFDDYSIVHMITKEDFSVSIISESGMLGVTKSNGSSGENLYFEPITFTDEVSLGDKVYTSGISDIYEKGLYVGAVSEIQEEINTSFKLIKITPGFDIMNISEVLVLNLKVEEYLE